MFRRKPSKKPVVWIPAEVDPASVPENVRIEFTVDVDEEDRPVVKIRHSTRSETRTFPINNAVADAETFMASVDSWLTVYKSKYVWETQ